MFAIAQKTVGIKKNQAMMILGAVGLVGVAGLALATNNNGGATEFGTIYGLIQGWLTGTLGKLISLACLGIGLVMGVPKQNIMAVVIGIVMAAAVAYGPGLLDSIVGVGLPLL